ncbi:flagellar export chaperone FliS [Allohahella sp. A8]|uniref:flagellar export chaperone FliS n=1 Tax=Allohahella sp. A8 TaxID=3141461 RepID=UPI000C0BA177|nr:flagellar export chaperone FliS [Hahellaceae bacterium]
MNALMAYQNVNRQTSVVDADPHRLIQLLFDGALERINMAKVQIQMRNFEGKNRLISKAMEIVGGLRSFLDLERGGSIASSLNELYQYIERRLLDANISNNIEILDEVAGLIREIKTGWDGIRPEVLEKKLV